MKRIIFILSVLMLLTAVSPFAYAEKKEGGEGGEATGPKPEFAYVLLDPLSLPIITNKGVSQQLSLLVSLEVAYDEQEKLATFKPRLADAYIQDLYGALGAGHGLMRGDVVNVTAIKERLSSVTDRVLGPELKVHGVLLQVLQQRPM